MHKIQIPIKIPFSWSFHLGEHTASFIFIFFNYVEDDSFIDYQIVPKFVFFQNFTTIGNGTYTFFYLTKMNFVPEFSLQIFIVGVLSLPKQEKTAKRK